MSAHEHALDKALIASFENGLPPDIRVEMIREDASQAFMNSKVRARKHEANKLRSANSQSTASVSSLLDSTLPPQLKIQAGVLENRVTQLEQQLRTNEDSHVSSAVRGRRHSRGPSTHKRGSSYAERNPNNHNQKKVVFDADTSSDGSSNTGGVECTYPGCAGKNKSFTHSRQECRTEQRDIKNGRAFVEVGSKQG